MAEMKKEYLDFRNRRHQVCDSSPAVPAHGMGRQTYLANKMCVSQEAARKWLSAESMPRKKVMQDLAKLLGVDEGWLSCGGEVVSKEEKKRVKQGGTGAEYLVYGLLTALGAVCSFLKPDELFSDRADITAIYKNNTAFIDVKMVTRQTEFKYHVDFGRQFHKVKHLVVAKKSGTTFLYYLVPDEVIEKAAVRNNDKLRLEVGFDIETDAMIHDAGTITPLTDIADLF